MTFREDFEKFLEMAVKIVPIGELKLIRANSGEVEFIDELYGYKIIGKRVLLKGEIKWIFRVISA